MGMDTGVSLGARATTRQTTGRETVLVGKMMCGSYIAMPVGTLPYVNKAKALEVGPANDQSLSYLNTLDMDMDTQEDPSDSDSSPEYEIIMNYLYTIRPYVSVNKNTAQPDQYRTTMSTSISVV